ncbi:hypothetical protein [Kitasatospora sp. CB02891]|uniref:hypothetical protein n=1 Tax=Kitasatospora sp. CB02891 TaxID=2020329 RepID=UPI003514D32D
MPFAAGAGEPGRPRPRSSLADAARPPRVRRLVALSVIGADPTRRHLSDSPAETTLRAWDGADRTDLNCIVVRPAWSTSPNTPAPARSTTPSTVEPNLRLDPRRTPAPADDGGPCGLPLNSLAATLLPGTGARRRGRRVRGGG